MHCGRLIAGTLCIAVIDNVKGTINRLAQGTTVALRIIIKCAGILVVHLCCSISILWNAESYEKYYCFCIKVASSAIMQAFG